MEKFLIFIKHHFRFIWRIIEWVNGQMFSLLHRSRLYKVLPGVFRDFSRPPFIYSLLSLEDSEPLFKLINSQNKKDLDYFRPHGFDLLSIKKQFANSSFLMMGVFDKEDLVGYFFLRFFANRTCFVGRLIDKQYRGSGIGRVMNDIMYHTAWRMNFRCLSTISRNNAAVMKAHSKNPSMIILKKLKDGYMLVEFIDQTRLKGKAAQH
ncbi:MAG TPA: hypothetical protein ENH59_10650 [Bacteroidetes bacterium]|nr:hypothetical protein [Bacteroidota bacterium]